MEDANTSSIARPFRPEGEAWGSASKNLEELKNKFGSIVRP
jgi:hypothetical protein